MSTQYRIDLTGDVPPGFPPSSAEEARVRRVRWDMLTEAERQAELAVWRALLAPEDVRAA